MTERFDDKEEKKIFRSQILYDIKDYIKYLIRFNLSIGPIHLIYFIVICTLLYNYDRYIMDRFIDTIWYVIENHKSKDLIKKKKNSDLIDI